MPEDFTELLCPHNKPLYFYEHEGIIHYQHAAKGEKPVMCDVLNAYRLPVESILQDMGKLETKVTPTLKASYACSLPLRLDYYAAIAKADTSQLEKFLVRIAELMDGAYNSEVLCWELHRVFGPVIFENLSSVVHKQYQMHAPDEQYKLPKYAMVNLADESRNNEFLELERKVLRSQQR